MMNKFVEILFLSIILNSFVVLRTMEITPVQVTHQYMMEFLKIVDEYRPFEEAVPHIKNLGINNKDWQKIFDDSTVMGELIQCAYENYKKDGTSYLLKAEMAISLGTKGSYAWSKQYLLSPEGAWEKKLFDNEFLRIAEQDKRERMSVLLNIGIDVNSTDQDVWFYSRVGGYQPALISAVKQLNFGLTTFLLEKNADPNIFSSSKDTPLIIIIQKLYKADKNKRYENFYKSFAILRLLLQQPALNISYDDALRKTASDYAIEYKMEWLQKLLGTHNHEIL